MIYDIKTITQEHTKEVIQLANKVFGAGAGMLISKKNMWGYYASDDQNIVGAIILLQGAKDEGFVQWIFVDPIAQGHKLASRLMDEAIKAFEEKGITKQFALVRDDNTASWNLFLKAGYKVIPFTQSLFTYSFKSFLHRLEYALVNGYTTWVKDDTLKQKTIYPKMPILRALLTALILGASVASFGFIDVTFLIYMLLTTLGLTILRMLTAYPIARSYGQVKFMPSRGGIALSVLLGIFTQAWYPVFGIFVPKEDIWKSHTFKKNLGLQSFATWMMMQGVFIASSLLLPDVFKSGLNYILAFILVMHLFPMFPFDGMDAGRVYRYHKGLYWIGLMISIITIGVFY